MKRLSKQDKQTLSFIVLTQRKNVKNDMKLVLIFIA